MTFTAHEALPGVFHIEDALGVCMTLLVGDERALLVDAGYGVEDVRAFARTLTDKPLSLLLTHAHHDHALGARWFDSALLFHEDAPLLPVYTGEAQRLRVLSQLHEKGLSTDVGFMTNAVPAPSLLAEGDIALGGLTARALRCPGHTPGSAAVYVPERRLLLTGDAWNPCAWLFFPEALPAREALCNLRRLLSLPFERVLCPHRRELYPREALERFVSGLTEDALRRAETVELPPYEAIDTRRATLPDGQALVFDWAKAGL